jgi:hypothetical protein
MPVESKREMTASVIGVCEEFRRLLDAYGTTIKEILHLHEEQFNAVVQGDPDCKPFRFADPYGE